jgi:hypothetical protein
MFMPQIRIFTKSMTAYKLMCTSRTPCLKRAPTAQIIWPSGLLISIVIYRRMLAKVGVLMNDMTEFVPKDLGPPYLPPYLVLTAA